MKAIKFETNPSSDFEQTHQKLLSDPRMQRFMRENDVDASFVLENLADFLNWIEEMNSCVHCTGLPFCTQPIRGKVRQLEIDADGFLDDTYVSCKFMKEVSNQLEHRKNFRFSHCSNREYFIDLSKIQLEDENAEYIQAYLNVQNSLSSDQGVYVYGQPGVGKTYLMMGVCNYYAKKGTRVSFVKVPLFIQELKQSFNDGEYYQTLLGHLRFSEVLVLDDIGSEAISPWARDEVLFPILDYRMEHHLKTYFTSNYSLKELEQQYNTKDKKNGLVASQRLMERIRALSQETCVRGASRR